MAIVLNDPEDVVATIVHHAEMVLCNQCYMVWADEHKHMLHLLSFTEVKAKVTGIHEKCDGCHANFLDTEF